MDIINEIKAEALSNNIPIIEDEGLGFIKKIIIDNECQHILEIGSAVGYSAIMMSLITNVKLVDTIERDKIRYDTAVTNINRANLNHKIRIFNEDALLINKDILLNSYDLIFIDAAKSQYQRFFDYYESLLSSDGFVLVDNINFHGMIYDIPNIKNRNTKQLVNKIKRFKDNILNDSNYDTKYYDVGDGMILIKRNG